MCERIVVEEEFCLCSSLLLFSCFVHCLMLTSLFVLYVTIFFSIFVVLLKLIHSVAAVLYIFVRGIYLWRYCSLLGASVLAHANIL